jgi:hypothetical protein
MNSPDEVDVSIQALRTCVTEFQFYMRGEPSPTRVSALWRKLTSEAMPLCDELRECYRQRILTQEQAESVEHLTEAVADYQIEFLDVLQPADGEAESSG